MSDDIPIEKTTRASRLSWPLWKKLTIAGVSLAVVIGLSVGLGVGLTRHNGGNDDDSNDSPSDNELRGSPSRASLWRPKVGDSFQIVLHDPIKTDTDIQPDVAVWDLDVYENDAATFKKLQDAGKKVICYFSAGSWEDYRDDADEFHPEDKGNKLDGWPHERWLKLSSQNVRNIMAKRIAIAASKGCDAIDPDNVDGFQNDDNGLGLTAQDSIDFMKFLYKEATSHNMSIGLKNAGDIIDDVISFVDFSVNEQCVKYKECETFSKFIKAGKPVFNIEYPENAPKITAEEADNICSRKGDSAGADGFTSVMKTMDLDGFVRYCDGKEYTTELSSN